jgi:hypothetical protein
MPDNAVIPPAYLTLARPNSTPPGGWRWTDPNTLTLIQANTFDSLVKDAETHRRVNNLPPIPDIRIIVMDQICRRIPSELSHGATAGVVGSFKANPSPRNNALVAKFSISESLSRTLVLLRAFRSQVSQAEAERRAAICLACPLNTQEQVCYSCSIKGTIDQWLGGSRTTGSDNMLALCGVDGTFSKAMVHVKAEYKANGGFPDGCWKKCESSQG